MGYFVYNFNGSLRACFHYPIQIYDKQYLNV